MKSDYFDLIERAENGIPATKEEWDFDKVAIATKNLVTKFDLKWNRLDTIPRDNDLIDRLFQAGLELAQTSGVYFSNPRTILNFTKTELEKGLQEAKTSLIMGEGKDSRILYARRVMDSRPPLVWAGNPGCPTPEELFQPTVMSWMQEPVVDLITCGSLTRVNGHVVRTGEPTEIAATRKELSLLREGLRKVGRPGMGMLAAQSSVSELGDLSAAHPDYLRPCDSHLVPILNELIMDNRNIARAVNSIDYGMRNASLACVMVGGLGGDAPGSAVLQIASFIIANLVCLADYHLLHPIHIRHVATSTRSVMWVQSAVSQAFARNAPEIIVADIYPKSGALTRELLLEVAANAIVISVSGAHLEGVGSADGNVPNGTGLEARLMGEVGHAVTHQNLSLDQANRIVSDLLELYEPVFDLPGGNPGVRFDHAYDLATLQPIPQWMDMYWEVKTLIQTMGLKSLNND
jgi:methylamine--corrinoid protein Co-methyltransferase